MNSLGVLVAKEMKDTIRSKKLLIAGILFLFSAIASPIIAKLIPQIMQNVSMPGITINIPEPSWKDAIDQYIKNINQIVGIVLVFLFAGTIAEEKSKKTLEIVLTKPISRSSYILSKFIAAFILLAACLLGGGLIFYFYTYSILGSFSLANFSLLTLVLMIYLFVITSMTILMSTIANSQLVAAGLAFLSEIILFTVLDYIKAIKNYLPGHPIAHYKEIMESGNISGYSTAIWISLAFIAILIISSAVAFKKQEVER